jgi:hypothetical protein
MKPSRTDFPNLSKLQDGRLYWMRGKEVPLVYDPASRAWVRDPKVTIGAVSDSVPLHELDLPALIQAGIIAK